MKHTAPGGEAADKLRAYFETHPGEAPSMRQLQEACGISSISVVRYNLRALAAAGFLTEAADERTARRYRLASATPDVLEAARALLRGVVAMKNDLAVVDSRALAALRKAVQG